ncbi:MAG: heavy-metal-associated domain-containing protein [Enterobacteriaceae bacterium]
MKISNIRIQNPNKQYTLSIEGMNCKSCVGRIEKALQAIDGVISAEVTLAAKQAVITAGSAVAAQTLVQAVEQAGYQAQEVQSAPVTIAPIREIQTAPSINLKTRSPGTQEPVSEKNAPP